MMAGLVHAAMSAKNAILYAGIIGGDSILGRKNETEYWIDRKERTKLTDTKPELALDEIARLCGFSCSKPKPVYIDGYDFRPDRLIMDFYVEALGTYHFTDLQESKTRRRSQAIVDATGKRLLLIDAPLLTDQRHWNHVIKGMVAFALGDDRLYFMVEGMEGNEEAARLWA